MQAINPQSNRPPCPRCGKAMVHQRSKEKGLCARCDRERGMAGRFSRPAKVVYLR